MTDRNAAIVDEFRTHHGKVGGVFEGKPILLLTHTGAKSGRTRTNPLMYLDDGDRTIVFASKGGHPAHPHWYLNVRANPDVTVEIADETFAATAVELTGEERDRIYAIQSDRYPQFGEYQARADRRIPVIALLRNDT